MVTFWHYERTGGPDQSGLLQRLRPLRAARYAALPSGGHPCPLPYVRVIMGDVQRKLGRRGPPRNLRPGGAHKQADRDAERCFYCGHLGYCDACELPDEEVVAAPDKT
ncbi:MAG: hypothetical protein ACREQ5_25690 [Candidatus Dormibacteria bacterium]